MRIVKSTPLRHARHTHERVVLYAYTPGFRRVAPSNLHVLVSRNRNAALDLPRVRSEHGLVANPVFFLVKYTNELPRVGGEHGLVAKPACFFFRTQFRRHTHHRFKGVVYICMYVWHVGDVRRRRHNMCPNAPESRLEVHVVLTSDTTHTHSAQHGPAPGPSCGADIEMYQICARLHACLFVCVCMCAPFL